MSGKMWPMYFSFWQYKDYADIREGFWRDEVIPTVGWIKMALLTAFGHDIL